MLIPHRLPLIPGRLVARYDRFIADVKLDTGELVRSHCVNPGKMEGMISPGARAWLSMPPESPTRKLRYTLELLEVDGLVMGANTQLPNTLVERLIHAGEIPGLKRFKYLRREVRYGNNSRIDILLESRHRNHYVEVKNCHLVYPDRCAYFPDSVSTRATEHLETLASQVEAGDKSTVVVVIQRDDAQRLRPSDLHDPVFAEAARTAQQRGVRFIATHFSVSPKRGFRFLGTVPVDLRRYPADSLAPFRDALADQSGWIRRKALRR
ncbi:MAG: DNA/RNA nuclease SfsA [Congregibacter sp.]